MIYFFIFLTTLTVINGLQVAITSPLIIIFIMLLSSCLLLKVIEEKSLTKNNFFEQKKIYQTIAFLVSIIGSILVFSLNKHFQSLKHISHINEDFILFFCVFGLAVYSFLKDSENVK